MGLSISGSNNFIKQDTIDSATLALNIVDYEHHEIHSGSHYFWEDFFTRDNTQNIDICIQTPDNTKWTHFIWVLSSTLGSEIKFYEGSDITFNGNDLTAYNNNRNSSNISNWVNFQEGATINSVGTLLAQSQLGTSSNPNQGLPGDGSRNREIILKQNTVYLLSITSLNNNNIITLLFEWYEHTNKI